jgi:hypothetical protein
VPRHFGRHELETGRHWRNRNLSASRTCHLVIMDKLFPIIRRKRRPLFIEDAPLIPANHKPVPPAVRPPGLEPAKKPKADNGKSSATSEAP